jgi:hypothetical protein
MLPMGKSPENGRLKKGVARRAVAAVGLQAVATGEGPVRPDPEHAIARASALPIAAAWRCIADSDAAASRAACYVILSDVNRRLRLALFLAALAAAGPMPSVRAVDAGRLDVTIAWFRSEQVVTPRIKHSTPAIPSPVVAHGFNAHSDPVLSPALLPHSLFQRPPPLQN